MSSSTMFHDSTPVVPGPGDPDSWWREALDPRGMFVTCLMALSGTVAVVVLTSAVLRLVTGG